MLSAICLGLLRELSQAQRPWSISVGELAVDGRFGDVGDWRTAEVRWRKNGITKEDFQYIGEHEPYDHRIAEIGHPNITTYSITYQHSDTRRVVLALAQLAESVTSSKEAKALRQMALFATFGLISKDRIRRGAEADFMLRVMEANERRGLSVENFDAFVDAVWRDEASVKRLSRLAPFCEGQLHHGSKTGLEIIVNAFNRKPKQYRGLLVLIARWIPSMEAMGIRIPSDLKPSAFSVYPDDPEVVRTASQLLSVGGANSSPPQPARIEEFGA